MEPQIGQGDDRGTYYYAQPTIPQFVIPFSNSMAYSLPYQSPFIESYSPTCTNSDFIDSQIVYYPAPYSYNILANMKALPHGIIPLPVQAVQNHAPYGKDNFTLSICTSHFFSISVRHINLVLVPYQLIQKNSESIFQA